MTEVHQLARLTTLTCVDKIGPRRSLRHQRNEASPQAPVADVDLFLLHRDVVESAITYVCHYRRLSADEANDFSSVARLHIFLDQSAVLRAFRGQSSLATYLTTVVTRQYLDWRNSRFGKWRYSAQARRLGREAQFLERLLVRDGLSMDEAIETLRQHGIESSRAELEAIAGQLPPRSRRVFLGGELLDERPSSTRSPAETLETKVAGAAAQRITGILRRALAELSLQDRLILRLHFEDGWSIAEIARILQLDQKPLYGRVTRLCRQMKDRLTEAGVEASEIRSVLDCQGFNAIDDGESGVFVRPSAVLPGMPGENT